MRQITKHSVQMTLTVLQREKVDLTFVCFTEYDNSNKLIAFKKVEVKNTFGEYLAAHNMKQAKLLKQKNTHVTFFFNSGVEEQTKAKTNPCSFT